MGATDYDKPPHPPQVYVHQIGEPAAAAVAQAPEGAALVE